MNKRVKANLEIDGKKQLLCLASDLKVRWWHKALKVLHGWKMRVIIVIQYFRKVAAHPIKAN